MAMKVYANMDEVRKHQKRQARHVNGMKAFIVVGLLAALGFGYSNVKAADAKDFSMDEIQKELSIHSGHSFDPDGRQISPFETHGCEVPLDEEQTPFIDRIAGRMASQYPDSVIEKVRNEFEAMYHGDVDDYKAAMERLDELDDQLEKGEDGKYHFKEVKNARMR